MLNLYKYEIKCFAMFNIELSSKLLHNLHGTKLVKDIGSFVLVGRHPGLYGFTS